MDILGEANIAWINTVRGGNSPKEAIMSTKALKAMREAAPEWDGETYKSAVVVIDDECCGVIFENKTDGLINSVEV